MSTLAYTPDLFAEASESQAPAKPYSEGDHSAGYYVPCGNIFMAEWREYDEALFSAIRRLLADGPKEYADICKSLDGGQLRPHELNCHLFRMQRTGEITETPRYFTTSDARDPTYRGWHPIFELAEGAA